MILFGLLLTIIGTVMYLGGLLFLRKNQIVLEPRDLESPRIAILVPARDESAVIGDLLRSLRGQNLENSMIDIYVIVENKFDPTVQIAEKFHAKIIYRQDLSKQRKGYALDDAVKEILRQDKHYDLYFIFDADNIVDANYLAEMLKVYRQGYEITTGYRNTKNGNANVIAAVSSLTFSMINAISNRQKIKYHANVIFSGTGCYVDGRLVEKWGGWPFHALTEDYEMSLYATLYGLTTFYNEKAVFYDEQPTKYCETVDQRIRWIRGYFESRRQFLDRLKLRQKAARNYGSIVRERIGVTPLILVLVGLACVYCGSVIQLIIVGHFWQIFCLTLGLFGLAYIVLWIVTWYILRHEKLKLSKKMRAKVLFFNPLYLLTYIPCAVRAILRREVTWKKIPHGNG